MTALGSHIFASKESKWCIVHVKIIAASSSMTASSFTVQIFLFFETRNQHQHCLNDQLVALDLSDTRIKGLFLFCKSTLKYLFDTTWCKMWRWGAWWGTSNLKNRWSLTALLITAGSDPAFMNTRCCFFLVCLTVTKNHLLLLGFFLHQRHNKT